MKAEYFYVDKSTNHNVIGNSYPQVVGLVKSYDESSNESLSHFAKFKGKEIDFIPHLDGLLLSKTSKVTDVISCSLGPGNDTVISSRILEIIFKFKTSDFQYFDCILYKGQEKYSYKWVHYIYSLERYVDYKNSEFIHPDEDLYKYITNIRTYQDFLKFYEEKDTYGLIKSKSITLKDQKFDFFVIGRFDQKLYVSRKLKDELLKSNISGVEFIRAYDLIIL